MPDNKIKTAALVTGAAGGLGSALVNKFRQSLDVDVVIATDIHPDIPAPFVDADKLQYFPMDVTSEPAIKLVRQELETKNIRVKYLINNAGVNVFFPISETNAMLLDQILKVNLYGPILTVSIFLDHLEAYRGRVVNISSDSVRLPIPFHPYPASKIAGEAFAVSMRRELSLIGVKLILIRPGAIQTNFIEEMKTIRNPIENSRFTRWFDKFAGLANTNVGRMRKPAEVAQLVFQALTAKKPRQYYTINKNRKISFFRYFPEKLQDRLLKKQLKPGN